jgi:hypothetical protein
MHLTVDSHSDAFLARIRVCSYTDRSHPKCILREFGNGQAACCAGGIQDFSERPVGGGHHARR